MSKTKPVGRAKAKPARRKVERISILEMLEVLITELLGRRPLLRAVALTIGAIVFMLHVSTALTPRLLNEWLGSQTRDMVYHISMLALFTFSYRLSYAAPIKRGRSRVARPSAPAADIATLIVCCAWGALCEVLQNYIPARDFNMTELAVNMLTPVLVIALVVAARNWRAILNW